MRSKASFAQQSPTGLAVAYWAVQGPCGLALRGLAVAYWAGGKGKGEACFSLRAKLLLKLEGLILDFGEYYGLLWTLCAIT